MTADKFDVTKSFVLPSGNIILPRGRLSYAQFLVNPQDRTDKKTGKTTQAYSMNLLVPGPGNKQGLPVGDFTELKKAMGKIALENCDGDKNRAKTFVEKRFLDPNNLPSGGKPAGEEFEGWVLIRGSRTTKPEFSYPNGNKIPDSEITNELYSGRWARPSVNVYWSNRADNKGVCIGLQNVWLLDHAENMGVAIPKAEDEFGDAGRTDDDTSSSSNDVDDMFS
jgi:hypothetical protein